MNPDIFKSPPPAPEPPPPAADQPDRSRGLPFAWQPLTPRGVAAFAGASFNRLFFVAGFVALLAAAALVWFLTTAWFPIVQEAIRRLPEQGAIQNQTLVLPQSSAEPLAENRFLSLVAHPAAPAVSTSIADVRVGFHAAHLRACSLLGCAVFRYPAGWSVPFNRSELAAGWAAWRPMVLGIIGLACFAGLCLTWSVLATLYAPVVRLLAYFGDREITWGGSWRLAAAALLPGALLCTGGLVAYGQGWMDLIRLLLVAGGHLPVGWIYLWAAPRRLPRVSGAAEPASNPFSDGPPAAPASVE